MNDLNKALADIESIRSQLEAGRVFQGFGPAVIAATGVLAFVTAGAQSLWPQVFAATDHTLLLAWIGTAAISTLLIGIEMVARSRRHHGGLADAMLLNAVEVFLPAGFAGATVAAVFMKFSPQSLWTLPGLWQIFIALGLFAALKFLPRRVAIVAAWYFLSGVSVLLIASASQTLDPWMMGLPFAAGQLLLALVLHQASGEAHDAG